MWVRLTVQREVPCFLESKNPVLNDDGCSKVLSLPQFLFYQLGGTKRAPYPEMAGASGDCQPRTGGELVSAELPGPGCWALGTHLVTGWTLHSTTPFKSSSTAKDGAASQKRALFRETRFIKRTLGLLLQDGGLRVCISWFCVPVFQTLTQYLTLPPLQFLN